MALKKADELVVRSRHAGVNLESEGIPVFDLALQPLARQSPSAKVGEKRRWLHFVVVRVENDFSDRLGLSLCFLGSHFDMFGHGWFPSRYEMRFFEKT